MNIEVYWRDIVGGEGDAVIMHGVVAVEEIKQGLHMNGHRLTCVG